MQFASFAMKLAGSSSKLSAWARQLRGVFYFVIDRNLLGAWEKIYQGTNAKGFWDELWLALPLLVAHVRLMFFFFPSDFRLQVANWVLNANAFEVAASTEACTYTAVPIRKVQKVVVEGGRCSVLKCTLWWSLMFFCRLWLYFNQLLFFFWSA